MWLSFSWSHAAQRSSQLGPVPESAGGLRCSPPVHLIAYTQPIWPAPEHKAITVHVLAHQIFLDLQVEDVVQVDGLSCELASKKQK